MDALFWLVFGIFMAIVVLGILITVFALKRRKKYTDYFAIFIIGFIWFIAGLLIKIWALAGLGGIFALIGLANHYHWGKNRITWKDLHKHDRLMRIAGVVFLILLLVFSIIFYLLVK